MNKVSLEYHHKQKFSFIINEETDGYIKGVIELDEALKNTFLSIQDEMDPDDYYWYLDDKGNRLEDQLLFEKSPWSIIYLEKRTKVVQRFFNIETGESWFATQPFIRLADWYYSH